MHVMNDEHSLSDEPRVTGHDRAVERGILDEEARIAYSDRLPTSSLDLFDPGFLLD